MKLDHPSPAGRFLATRLSGLRSAVLAVAVLAAMTAATPAYALDAPVVTNPVDGASFAPGEIVPFSVPSASSPLQCKLDGGDWQPCPVNYTPGDGQQIFVGWNTRLIFGQVPGVTPVRTAQFFYGGPRNSRDGQDRGATFADASYWPSDPSACERFPAWMYWAYGAVLGTSMFNIFIADCSIQSKYSTGDLLQELPLGNHQLLVRASSGGSVSEATSVQFTIARADTVAPDAPVLSGAPGALTTSTDASISFSGEDGASFTCSVDRGSYSACSSSPFGLSGLSDGLHSLAVKATDEAGNTSSAATAYWRVGTSGPGAPDLSGEPSGTVSSGGLSVSISGEDGATFQCSLDGAEFNSCTSPLQMSATDVDDGPHSLEVRQVDAAGNVSIGVARAEWVVDSQAPAAPSAEGNRSGFTSQTSASVSFQTDDDSTALCAVDGGEFAECDSPVELSGLGDGEHSVSVKQRNTAGTISLARTVAWIVDTQAPGTPDLSGLPADYSTADSATANVSVGEDHLVLNCSVDGSAFVPCDTQAGLTSVGYVASESLSGLGEGSHTFSVKSVDRAGNESPAAAHTWIVDTITPDAPSVASNRSGYTKSRTASVLIGSEAGAVVECRLDGGEWGLCGSSPKSLTGLEDGLHTLSVRQTDAAGNVSDEASDSWTVDNVAPASPGVSLNRSGVTNLRSASVDLTGEDGASFTCKLDSGSWVACDANKSLTNLGDGRHALYAKQVDRAGNVSVQASAGWTVSTLTLTHGAVLSAGTLGSVTYGTQITSIGFAVSGESDGNGQVAYIWQRCSSALASSCSDWATGSSWTVGKADVGYRLRLIQTFTSSDGISVSSTTPLTGVVVPYADDVPVIGVPDSLSSPAYGRVLTASGPTWLGFMGQPAANQISYRWQRCSSTRDNSCASIGGATNSTYTVTTYEVTRRMRLLVGVTVGTGSNQMTVWVPSAISGVVTNTGKNTAAPSITFKAGYSAPKRHVSLGVKPGSWAYTWLGFYTYQWQACDSTSVGSCSDISGATKSTYTPQSFLVGKRLRVLVTYLGHDRTGVTAATAITSAIAS